MRRKRTNHTAAALVGATLGFSILLTVFTVYVIGTGKLQRWANPDHATVDDREAIGRFNALMDRANMAIEVKNDLEALVALRAMQDLGAQNPSIQRECERQNVQFRIDEIKRRITPKK